MAVVADLEEQGYAIARGVFSRAEMEAVAAEMDRLRGLSRRHHTTYREGNLLWVVRPDGNGNPRLRFVHWVGWVSELLAEMRVDPRVFSLIQPLVGGDVKQMTNTASWKEPGSTDTVFGWHQDSSFRRPASAFRDLWTPAYVYTFTAIDEHRLDNGCLRVVRGSHRLGKVPFPSDRSVMDQSYDDEALRVQGIDPADAVPLVLDPGDVAMWLGSTIHGSGPNRSSSDRRACLNGYARAAATDRGEWAFRDGLPCALTEPSLIQYEDLFTRPEPHYVDGALYPPAGRGS